MIFLMLYSIDSSNLTVWLTLLPEIQDTTLIVIVCCTGCDVIGFEINLGFLIKLILDRNMATTQRLKLQTS